MGEKQTKEGKAERASRFLRNINLLGAVALEGAAVLVPPLAVPLTALAAFDVAQAGGFEVARRASKKHRLKKSDSNK
jgi:hypothetical protein